MKRGLFLLAALLWFNTNAFCQDPNFYIFLCFGQSNMEGFSAARLKDVIRQSRLTVNTPSAMLSRIMSVSLRDGRSMRPPNLLSCLFLSTVPYIIAAARE
jgi:hypothetical protein